MIAINTLEVVDKPIGDKSTVSALEESLRDVGVKDAKAFSTRLFSLTGTDLTTTLKRISKGRIALGTKKKHFNEWRAVYVDDKEMPYEGFQVNGGK